MDIKTAESKGIAIFEKTPNGWVLLEEATTQPNGYKWYSNGESRFGGQYESGLVKDSD